MAKDDKIKYRDDIEETDPWRNIPKYSDLYEMPRKRFKLPNGKYPPPVFSHLLWRPNDLTPTSFPTEEEFLQRDWPGKREIMEQLAEKKIDSKATKEDN